MHSESSWECRIGLAYVTVVLKLTVLMFAGILVKKNQGWGGRTLIIFSDEIVDGISAIINDKIDLVVIVTAPDII